MSSHRVSVVSVATMGIVAALVLFGAGAGHAQEAAPIPTSIDHAPGERIDSSVCAVCHQDIYVSWAGSVHAEAHREPVFQTALTESIAEYGATVADTCLTCHSPATVLLEQARPGQQMEGVNCQSCHTIRASMPLDFPPYEVDRRLRFYGPYADAESPVHQTSYSEFMTSAEYCAGCHEYTGPAGAHVLSTFTEFESGSYPPLTDCQGCHMPLVPGHTVSTAVKSPPRSDFIRSHRMPGGRSLDQLRRAVALEIVSAERTGGGVVVEVAVENQAAGHFLPTGMPTRQLVLEVSTLFDQETHTRSFVFGRRVVDEDGERLSRVQDMILRGAEVTADSRLRPRQRRTFTYTLQAPTGLETTLVARIYAETTQRPDEPPVARDIVRIERPVD